CFCFFFSSRRRHTRFSRDWSSDVCSSDLRLLLGAATPEHEFIDPIDTVLELYDIAGNGPIQECLNLRAARAPPYCSAGCRRSQRSEERRVGKEWRSRWWASH